MSGTFSRTRQSQFIVLALFFTLLSLSTRAQLLRWNTRVQKGFVFQINNKEAQRLLTHSTSDTIFSGMLHTLVDTFNVDKGWLHRPSQGHFIMARIIESKVHCEYTSVFPYQVFLLKEYDGLALQVLDLDGNVRDDAKVKFKLKKLHIDPQTKTYRIAHEWFPNGQRFVTVELNGFRSVFNIEKHEVEAHWRNNWYGDDPGPSFYSYMITDKNKYKPLEKVRFKSYALSQSRTPLHRDLELWIVVSDKSWKLATVAPHRPGSFASEFQLHDSLKLRLDRPYQLQLRDKGGRIVSNCHFRYEDYELNGNKLDISLATPTQFHPVQNKLKILATDVNGLQLKDAKAQVLVKLQSIRETFQPLVILSDTLMYKEIDLGDEDASSIEIPSKIFGKANVVYDVIVTMTNSQNQRLEQKVTAIHYYSQYQITTRFSNDSIVYDFLDNSISVPNTKARLKYNDQIDYHEVVLPYKDKLNPTISKVLIETTLASRLIQMNTLIPSIKIKGGIQKDSFNIQLQNPQLLDVSWYIYQGNELLQKGHGDSLEYKSVIENRTETYYVELLYSFGGQENITRTEYPFREDYLNVAVDLPDRVYPGQKVDALIRVTNQLGDPMSGVDLTALSVTGKLNYYLPDLPYYGDTSSPRSRKANYTKSDVNKHFAIIDLEYKRWEKLARLDTMKYYQFTFPKSGSFSHSVAIMDSTQFSVYVMQKGDALGIYVIEVDRIPIYYSWVDQPRHYSFYVSPGRKHQITLRLYDRVLILDSLAFQRGHKTIFSLDINRLPSTTKVVKLYERSHSRRGRFRYPKFTPTEIGRHNMYLASFKRIERKSYLENASEFTPLFTGEESVRKPFIVVGPISQGRQTFVSQSTLKITYQHTGHYTYAFEDNIVYKLNPEKLIPDRLQKTLYSPAATVNDLVVTKHQFLTEQLESNKWHTQIIDMQDYAMRVGIWLPHEPDSSGIAALLFQDPATKQMISPCQKYSPPSEYFTIPRGLYNAVVLFNNGQYLKMDSVGLKSHRQVIINFNQSAFHATDSMSLRWLTNSFSNCYTPTTLAPRTFTLRHTTAHYGNVRGVIYDDMNFPLPGASVVVKGTVNGAVTDIDGKFYLDVTETPVTLVVSFIGYQMQEIDIRIGSDITIFMVPDVQQLQEVVVTGYGTNERKEMLAASISLRGAVSGVQQDNDIITPEPEDEEGPVEELKNSREAERKLYQELLNLKQIRSDFSDVGFWEPKLFTDKQGRSAFSVKFPDDITRWDATVYAMNRHLQTGTFRKSIKSYKPIMAELHVPQFLTLGDSSYFLGKVLNYSDEKEISGKVSWTGSTPVVDKDISLGGFHTDKFLVSPVSIDSVRSRYSFTRDDGYFDGEERTIPVIQQGIIRAEGSVGILNEGDNVHIQPLTNENVTVEVFSNQIDVFAGDARYLVEYRYACNEQLASKLIGLINYKMVMQFEGKPFHYDRDINKIIGRLIKNQNSEFLWSWWDVSPQTSYWMSSHILRALKAAKDSGYKVDLDIENIARKATYKFDIRNEYDLYDIDLLNALANWGAKLSYEKYVRRLEQEIKKAHERRQSSHSRYYRYSLLNEKMLLLETRQLTNLPYSRDSLLRYKNEAMLGQIHFTENKPARFWYEDELASNAIAYRIVKRDSALQYLKVPMQLYFLSSRKSSWNTYHSSNVLMSVLPDMVAAGASKARSATVQLSGKFNKTVSQFPLHFDIQPGEELNIKKVNGQPLYYMQYIEERVTERKTGVDGFAIKTTLENGNINLKAGEPVTLNVEVEVKKESTEYAMIEVPIPAGCSYADKKQNHHGVETHREYFKDRTVIFCEAMRPGKYNFVIQLLPRFTGKYFVNPAQISLMYIPVVNANTEMKVVKIVDSH